MEGGGLGLSAAVFAFTLKLCVTEVCKGEAKCQTSVVLFPSWSQWELNWNKYFAKALLIESFLPGLRPETWRVQEKRNVDQ